MLFRSLMGNAAVTDLRTGDLEVRLADSAAAIEAAQALRFRVFYQEMAAVPTAEMAANQRDFDSFDPYCDHLLAIDHSRGSGAEAVVGTYRLLRRDVAERHGGFYSAAEYDLSNLLRYPDRKSTRLNSSHIPLSRMPSSA